VSDSGALVNLVEAAGCEFAKAVELFDDGAPLGRPDSSLDKVVPTYDHVCLGGTFDILHEGHFALLTEAVLLTRKRLVVGVSTGPLLAKKKLRALIAPAAERVAGVEEFVRQLFVVNSSGELPIQVEVVPIEDAAGPAAVDGELQCIVLSAETRKGGIFVNGERASRNLAPLHIHEINDGELLQDNRTKRLEEVHE